LSLMLNDGWVTVQGACGHSDRNPSVCTAIRRR
jgi:hypothetical protein